ncbi:MAG: hypothetical protein PHS14_13130 [Elusimicrobia bacterium]|nr:hypothetical protein [Elusimicrobiota bacterium]
MSLVAIYSSPTTPGGAGWSEDVSGDIRLGSITTVAIEAELGAVGNGNIVLDDPNGTVGHASDGIVGLKQFHMDELACPPGNQRLWTGYVADRRYYRGNQEASGTPSSLITGVARKIDITLVDLNDFLAFRVFAPVATDPTSSFDRPAETTLQRIAALLAVDFLSTTLFDIGYIPATGGVALDANDYTGYRPQDVLNDIAQKNKWNYFVTYDEATNHYVLWMDDWKTDGSATKTFDSTLQLTNVLSEVDDVTTFRIEPDAVGTLDPSRIVTAEYGTGTGVTGYRTLPSTANTFAWRDGAPVQMDVKSQTKLDAWLDADLVQNSTEDNRISCTVRVPNDKVTAIKAGQRIQCHFTHIPEVQSAMTWCRILQMTIAQAQQTPEFYWLSLELSPIPPVVTVYSQVRMTFPIGTDTDMDLLFRSPGDPPHTGCSVFPQMGLLTYGPAGTFIAFTSNSILVNGNGTLDDIHWAASYNYIGSPQTLTPSIQVNGINVASTSFTVGVGGAPIGWDLHATSVVVSAGDVITGHLHITGSTRWGVPAGAGGCEELLEASGNLVAP